MIGQRVTIKVDRPQGDFDFPINLKNTEGVIIRELPSDVSGGALIMCDADECIWAFKPSEYEVIDEEEKMMDDNLFHELRDNAFYSVLDDYEEWNRTGFIPDDGVLAKIRDNYSKKFDSNCLLMMERFLLWECIIRLQRQRKQQEGV